MLCWFCEKVKGKRSCPARGGDAICSRCCGTKRRVEIDCPEDCPYLHGEHDARWESSARQAEEGRFLSRFAGISEDEIPALIFLHHLLLETRNDLRGELTDDEAREIALTLSKTFGTLAKGIVYEHQTDSLRLQGRVKRLAKLLSHRQELAGVPAVGDQDLHRLLERIAAAIEAHRKDSPASRSYLDLAERVFRPALDKAPPLELPEEEGTARRLIVEP